jgi:uncharacterized MnhB-related membrane protein
MIVLIVFTLEIYRASTIIMQTNITNSAKPLDIMRSVLSLLTCIFYEIGGSLTLFITDKFLGYSRGVNAPRGQMALS